VLLHRRGEGRRAEAAVLRVRRRVHQPEHAKETHADVLVPRSPTEAVALRRRAINETEFGPHVIGDLLVQDVGQLGHEQRPVEACREHQRDEHGVVADLALAATAAARLADQVPQFLLRHEATKAADRPPKFLEPFP